MSRIDDGFPTLISFSALDSGVSLKLWEKEVTPPGMDGGGPNDTTNMRNTLYRTRSPKKLISLATMTFTAMYDPTVFAQLLSVLNVNQQITITFPDDTTLIFWGWLDKFVPNAVAEGSPPTANCTIEPSNQDSTGAEVAPSGTCMA